MVILCLFEFKDVVDTEFASQPLGFVLAQVARQFFLDDFTELLCLVALLLHIIQGAHYPLELVHAICPGYGKVSQVGPLQEVIDDPYFLGGRGVSAPCSSGLWERTRGAKQWLAVLGLLRKHGSVAPYKQQAKSIYQQTTIYVSLTRLWRRIFARATAVSPTIFKYNARPNTQKAHPKQAHSVLNTHTAGGRHCILLCLTLLVTS